MSHDRTTTGLQEREEQIGFFQAYLEERHKGDIKNILLVDDPSGQFSVVVNALELFDSNIEISQKLLAAPNKMLPLFDVALAQAAVTVMQQHSTQISFSLKSNLHVRLSNLPICPELKRDTIPKSSDIGRFIAVTGKQIYFLTLISPNSSQPIGLDSRIPGHKNL